MIHILSEYHAKRKDENGEHAKDAPHGTDEENHHRQNPQGAKRPCRFLGVPSVASHPEPGKVELLTG